MRLELGGVVVMQRSVAPKRAVVRGHVSVLRRALGVEVSVSFWKHLRQIVVDVGMPAKQVSFARVGDVFVTVLL